MATINGLSYYGRTGINQTGNYMTSITIAEVGYYSGSTWIRYPVPTDYILLYTGIKKDGVLVDYRGATNSGSAGFIFITLPVAGVHGSAYTAHGYVAGYNPNTGEYEGGYLIKSPIRFFNGQTTSGSYAYASSTLASNVEAQHLYDSTSELETYGSLDVADTTGVIPDWIIAQTSNGEVGYIKSDSLNDCMPKNPSEALLMTSTKTIWSIPVYAEPGGGEVIGQFNVHFTCDGKKS